MFFRLPIEAVVENWIGAWLNETILRNFDRLDKNQSVSIGYVSLTQDQRDRLQRRAKLLRAVRAALKAYKQLNEVDRSSVRQALIDQRNVPAMLDGQCEAKRRIDLPEPVRAPLDVLSKAAFEALDDLGIRRSSLAQHFHEANGRTCAFCGQEPVESGWPADPDWDHYLARTLYPFASYNLRNLTPMGVACNRTYKRAKDVLRRPDQDSNHQRLCYDPYIHGPVSVHLKQSNPFGDGSRPSWVVTMEGDQARNEAWDEVFQVTERWKEQLMAKYDACLRELAGWFMRTQPPSDDALLDALQKHAGPPALKRAYGDDILRHAVFDHWLDYFMVEGVQRQRLGRLFRDAVAQRGRL